ncbi:MAG: dihydroorotate dehydrogenase electron transfer subunit, partial [Anaerolineae bacterium]
GPFTEACCRLGVGDRIWLRGPYGHGFEPVGERPLLLAGGCGAAGLALLAKRFRVVGTEVAAVVGARSADGLMLAWRYRELGCDVTLATDDGSAGVRGTTLDAAEDAWQRADAVYACGPEPMLQAVALEARRAGVPVWVSLERVMKCGIGVCGSCHCGDKLVCVDGPVFDAATYLDACR